MKIKFDKFQQLGRALMLPIALLPIAGILLRIGQPDILNLQYISDAGNAVFTNLPLLFALGVAVGLARDNNGTSALASAVGYLIMTTILTSINKDINTGVLGGILIGILAATLYNKYKDIKLPEYLAFFGGKRFVPIITGLVAVILGFVLGYVWPSIQNGINTFGLWLLKSGSIGLFFYGTLNRLLLVTGLHHVLNNLVWFVFGDYTNAQGIVVHGDIARFMAGDQSAGAFMTGFFPIMMFGLPAACLAMYKNALPEYKKAVGGLLLSMALTSFLTGVTEPIEFSFVFLAPLLYVIHAVLTGLSMAILYLLNVHLGFTFSAGFIDYVLFFSKAQHPIYLLPVGVVTFGLYYLIFDFSIRKFNLLTMGRDVDSSNTNININLVNSSDSKTLQFIESLGGSNNLVSVDACTTRLRLIVKDSSNINKNMLKSLGAKGIIAPAKESLQIIIGPTADNLASEIRLALANNSHITANTASINHHVDKDYAVLAKQMIDLLGGNNNIDEISIVGLTRLRIKLKNSTLVSDEFAKLGLYRLINIDKYISQLYIGSDVQEFYNHMIKYQTVK